MNPLKLAHTVYKGLANPNLQRVFELHNEYKRQHPLSTKEEWKRVRRSWLGKRDPLPEGVLWEPHCHTTCSDGDLEPGELVDLMFENGIEICSVTDHNNQRAWNLLRDGKWDKDGNYSLNERTRMDAEYDVSLDREGRSLVIYDSGNRRLIIPRSIEYMTEDGELCFHGLSRDFPVSGEKMPLRSAIQAVKDLGGFAIINHVLLWEGIAWRRGEKAVEEAVEAGALGIEVNGAECWPQYHSSVAARQFAKRYDLALIATGDAHKDYMFGRSGVSFPEDTFFEQVYNKTPPSEVMQVHLETGAYTNYLNYLNPFEFLEFFGFGISQQE